MTIEYAPPEIYRGVKLHSFQTRERTEGRVKPQIDYVMGLNRVEDLFRYCGDASGPPEARLLAAAMLEAIFNQAVVERRERPNIDLTLVGALVAGLEEGSCWRSPTHYSNPYDDGAEERPEPLTDDQLLGRAR